MSEEIKKAEQDLHLNLDDLAQVAGGAGGHATVTLQSVMDVLRNNIGKETVASYMSISKQYAKDQCTELAIPYLLRIYPGYSAEEMREAIYPAPSLILKAMNAIFS